MRRPLSEWLSISSHHIEVGMANTAKQKGDRAEREAVETLVEFCPHLLVESPMRMLGAGRRDDVGDLRVFDDVAVQVRAYAPPGLGAAIRSSASDSLEQASRAGQHLGLGMVPIPNRPRLDVQAVRWLAATDVEHWPEGRGREAFLFGSVSKLIGWLDMRPTSSRPDLLPIADRIAILETKGCAPVMVGTLQAWIADFEHRLHKSPSQVSGLVAAS